MKKLVPVLFLICAGMAPARAERRGDQGIGVILGKPSGFSYKTWIDETVAVDGAAGIDEGEVDIHATLLFHRFDWAKNSSDKLIKGITDSGEFPFYFGFGPRLLFRSKTELGIRFPVGLSYLPHETQWEFFGELAPVLRVTPNTGIDADFAVGLRYYFPAIRPRSR